MTLLFWNINRKHLAHEIKMLCDLHEVDILILAENKMEDVEVLSILNENNNRTFIAPFNPSKKISFYTRYEKFELVHDDNFWGSIRKITHPLGVEILLVAVHIQSKLHATDQEQAMITTRIVSEINQREQEQNHTRTIVIGDFNMNPFEIGLINSEGFHAIMDQKIALKNERTVLGVAKKLFYNPMWSCLGDMSKGMAGTYYYNSSGIINYFWNMFDQVLIRPSLIETFNFDKLQIIDKIDNLSLIENGKISKQFSDHLPLMITLDISKLLRR
jgi:exonuclease III